MKLKSGRDVKLVDLTYAQREECEDAATVRRFSDGSFEVTNLNKARTLWCRYGLALEEVEDLNDFSSDELAEIGDEIQERATRGVNPTKSAS